MTTKQTIKYAEKRIKDLQISIVHEASDRFRAMYEGDLMRWELFLIESLRSQSKGF